MQIKSFSAPTSKEVLAQIKKELGPDAVILDTQEEDGLITMTAALERAPVSTTREPLAGAPSRFSMPRQRTAEAPLFPPPDEQEAGQDGDGDAPTYSPRGKLRSRPAARMDMPDTQDAEKGAWDWVQPLSADMPGPARTDNISSVKASARQGAAQPSPQTSGQRAKPTAEQSPVRIVGQAMRQPEIQTGPYGSPPPGWQHWHEEWSSIKNHLLALMKPALRLDLLPPRQRLAIEFLQREGVEDAAVLHIFQRLQTDPAASILAPLAQLTPVRAWSPEVWSQRVHMIAGPFGAGKTSSAIRMALSLRRAAPTCRICMLNADATRGNGRLLLRHYCDLSDMAYKEASTTLELVTALNEALRENYDRIIVDLPGFSRNRRLSTLIADAGLADLCGEGPDDLAVHLVLPPHYGSLQMRGVLERYRVPHAGSIVWTKLDEAEHYGQIVNVAVGTGLPVSALSFGPGLGNSLVPAKENMLWRLLFKRELPIGT
jgi:flagellar biosynthesis protein FlhF